MLPRFPRRLTDYDSQITTMTDTTQPVRIGLIGAGANTKQRHIPGFQAIDGIEITCVANRTKESAQVIADEYGIPQVHESWQDVIACPNCDAVMIGTWPNMHAEITVAALKAGKHVLCEARMARDLAEARTMMAAAKEHKKLVSMLVPSPFGLEVGPSIEQLVRDHYIGDLREVHVVGVESTFWDYTRPVHWRQNKEISGLNTLTLGILFETVARWTPDVERVFAQTQLFEPTRADLETGEYVEVDVPDSVQVLAELKGGVRATFNISGAVLFGPGKSITLYGSRGTIRIELEPEETVYAARMGDDKLVPVEIPDENRGGWNVEAEFVAAIRGEGKVEHTTFADGVRYMQFTEAVARSAEAGEPIDLPLER